MALKTGAFKEANILSYEPLMTDAEFEKLIEPTPFANGTGRQAHAVSGDHSVVVKKIKADCGGANYVEWFIWNAIKEMEALAPIFGRCVAISTTGRYLMMERLDNLSKGEASLTPTLPDWVTDVKGTEPFGKNLDGEVKIRDYGLVKLGDALAAAPRWRRPWQGDSSPTKDFETERQQL